jgi:hypothetical protein
MGYAICFDWPEMNGEPMFAGWHKGAPGFAPQLETAAKFETEEEAERMLKNGYGPSVAVYGKVVEVSGTKQ